MIKLVTKPILALDWGKPLVGALGHNTVSGLPRDLRIAGIISDEYGELVRQLKNTSGERN